MMPQRRSPMSSDRIGPTLKRCKRFTNDMTRTSPKAGNKHSDIRSTDSRDPGADTSRAAAYRRLTPAEIKSLQNDKKRGAERAAELRAMEKG
ncbi:hypothetical protein [Thioalkalivibrio sp. ALJT]|uniref:hypothetical protein n=1 Tax=Thioalkalivibrio sp. ALJT TaxID=1158146 RepID=UPI000377268F|nr:hypothetical protein [Thioalkalivibrio sp. ALJT]